MIIILLELPRASGREFATLLFLPASAARFFERLDRQSRKCLTFLRRASIPRRSTARELNYDNGIHFALSRLASAVSFLSTRFSKCRRPRDMASPSGLSLLPPSPIPSAAHSRSPIEVPHLLAPSSSFLSTNSSNTSNGTTTRTQLPTNQDWWKWATPTIDLAAKSLASPTGDLTGIEMNMARTGVGEGDSGFVGSKEGRKDGKMVGDWRLGQALGSGMSGKSGCLWVRCRRS